MSDYSNLIQAIVEGNYVKCVELTNEALNEGASPQDIVTAVKEHAPDIVGMSALLTTTMPNIQYVIAALGSAALRSRVKVIVGGAPVTQRFADQIGADGYAPDGGAAISLCRKVLGE